MQKNEMTSQSTMPLLRDAVIRDLIPEAKPRTRSSALYREAMNPDGGQNSIACEDLDDVALSERLKSPLTNPATSTPKRKSPLTIVDANETSSIATQLSDCPLMRTIPAASQGEEYVYDLNVILNDSLEGRGLLNIGKNNPLDTAARACLVRTIGKTILRDTPLKTIKPDEYAKWAQEIVRVFPRENPSVYFHTKIVETTRGVSTRLAGKLPDQVHNLRRKYRELGVLEKRKPLCSSLPGSVPPSSSLRLPESFTTEQAEENQKLPDSIKWLKKFSEPWTTVEKKWTETTRSRLNQSKNLLVSQYFKEYPALRKPTGYVLLEKDFEELYAGEYTEIFETFPTLKENIFNLAKKRKTINNKDKALSELLSLQDASREESSNIACMLLIPTLLGVTSVRMKNNKKKLWRLSKSEAREYFITHVKNYSDVNLVINARKEKFREFGLTVQPFIVIVGPSLDAITSYFIIIDEVWYDLPDILSVVSACFKLIWVVNAEFSAESHTTWSFIQQAYFTFKTKFDRESTSYHSLLGELGIDV